MSWLILIAYVVIFIGLVIAAGIYQRRTRKDRRPFPDNFKLLRGPGETLRRRTAELSESLAMYFFIALSIPITVSFAFLWVTTKLEGSLQLYGLLLTVIALIASLVFSIRQLVAVLNRWTNHDLGHFGERIVGEALDPLKSQGFRVFHDVPAGDAKNPFNLDHVIVGPSGVFAIETKTRRKGRARAGFAEHEIIYDGQVLAYPWGEDRHGLDQALRQARWLQTWLGQLLGSDIPVQPILTFPGWMVITRARGAVTVLNPKQIPAAVALRGAPMLDADQIDLVSRQLEARCRDVEF